MFAHLVTSTTHTHTHTQEICWGQHRVSNSKHLLPVIQSLKQPFVLFYEYQYVSTKIWKRLTSAEMSNIVALTTQLCEEILPYLHKHFTTMVKAVYDWFFSN